MFLFTTIVFYYAIAHQLAHALPVMKRIVISPRITSPQVGTVWTPGSSQLVTWDTSAVPPNGTFSGVLVLGFQTPGSVNENLNLDQPLATGFSLRDGSVHVTCPTVSPGNNYIVVLFGDSGNASPPFTISALPGVVSPSSTQPSSTGLVPSPPPVSTTSTSSVSQSASGPLALALSTSLSATPSKESANLKSNSALSRIQNPNAVIASAVVSVFTIFLL